MIYVYIPLLIFLLMVSAALSASETALFSLSSFKLKTFKHQEEKFARIAELMAFPQKTLVTILILNVMANLLVQNTVSNLFGSAHGWLLKVGIPLVLTLVFGEILPKSIALPNNEKIAKIAAPWILRTANLLRVVRRPLTKVTVWISRALFFFLKEEPQISPEERRHILQASLKKGVLSLHEGYLIDGMLDLQQAHVKELMRPRDEILFYKVEQPLEKLEELFVDHQVSKVPLCKGNLEGVIGILSIEQFFFYKDQVKTSQDLVALLKKPRFVPETMNAFSLLTTLRESKEDLSLVIDEYGSISGLVSQEDLIEAVIGNVSDAKRDKQLYTKASSDVIIASGKLELADFKEIFSIALISKEHNVTLGGWLVEQLEEIPQTGTKYATDEFLFYVLSADQKRIRQIYVRKIKGKA